MSKFQTHCTRALSLRYTFLFQNRRAYIHPLSLPNQIRTSIEVNMARWNSRNHLMNTPPGGDHNPRRDSLHRVRVRIFPFTRVRDSKLWRRHWSPEDLDVKSSGSRHLTTTYGGSPQRSRPPSLLRSPIDTEHASARQATKESIRWIFDARGARWPRAALVRAGRRRSGRATNTPAITLSAMWQHGKATRQCGSSDKYLPEMFKTRAAVNPSYRTPGFTWPAARAPRSMSRVGRCRPGGRAPVRPYLFGLSWPTFRGCRARGDRFCPLLGLWSAGEAWRGRRWSFSPSLSRDLQRTGVVRSHGVSRSPEPFQAGPGTSIRSWASSPVLVLSKDIEHVPVGDKLSSSLPHRIVLASGLLHSRPLVASTLHSLPSLRKSQSRPRWWVCPVPWKYRKTTRPSPKCQFDHERCFAPRRQSAVNLHFNWRNESLGFTPGLDLGPWAPWPSRCSLWPTVSTPLQIYPPELQPFDNWFFPEEFATPRGGLNMVESEG